MMEEKKIFVNIANSEILEVSDMAMENTESITVGSLDEAIDSFNEKNWEFDDNIRAKLEEIFSEDEGDVLEAFDIKVSTENRSYNELADMFKENDIRIPDVQRKFVWDTNKCSKLIESILIGLPIPPLFFMDIGNNSYEVIDGLQRLTAISNYILGNQWGALTNDTQRRVPAKLSSNVDSSIQGKKFQDLTADQQKKLKRSTVTVIDFRQIGPENDKAKYLIFERINTGSELLNPMQIRKALAYGKFMSSLYEAANSSDVLKSMYSKQYLNKDRHVEFMLGVYVTLKVLQDKYTLQASYQKYILNDFCEANKDRHLESSFVRKFDKYLGELLTTFESNNIFKKVNSNGEYHGNRSTNISEVLVATAILEDVELPRDIEQNYKREIAENNGKFIQNKINKDDLTERYNICKAILGV
ncbi:TPA: DUF262 domain-containing protein [Enterococcus faecium]|uniref:DUF262 domain-containing protein n=1 Tax=Enterococcus TaxID=1350 RepID=UPI000B0D22E7|nr:MULTISPECIES: DUF262 domain-containing protein [Enterococcus]KAA9167778.1 DUF262 domain-containing protein [Enterococcus faecium]KAA9206852.1 DUF262 domain-containing protein [Enterococcus faecium]MBZ3636797.1 DUF262 domain-containing protein [Enterococcus faecium]MBZ3639193.1 DUF262 domain-containing protein [Enterococcus faecium]MBZ3650211.1 DUF262 domain-containing protein [Enterococcus faecium]